MSLHLSKLKKLKLWGASLRTFSPPRLCMFQKTTSFHCCFLALIVQLNIVRNERQWRKIIVYAVVVELKNLLFEINSKKPPSGGFLIQGEHND